MKPVRIHAISLGCPKNRVDTENLLGGLGPVEPVDDPAAAEVVLVNTCGFISPAVDESVTTILRLASESGGAAKRPLLVAAGCMVTRYRGEVLAPELPEVDLWLELSERQAWAGRILAALGRESSEGRGLRAVSTPPSYAYLKISEGCCHACSFCTIPSIRGPLASRPASDIEREARALVAGGAKELVVVAQDTSAWGRDLAGGEDLRHLLDKLLDIGGLLRLRLMYLYPAGLTEGLLDYLKAAGEVFVPYFDVPLQHAHENVLSKMGRPFSRSPERVVERIRSRFPGAALRTSLITGFPGEGEEEFAALTDFVARTRFHHLGVFAFQPEEGTPAAAMEGGVEPGLAEARREAVMELQAEISRDILSNFEGREMDVLVDEASPEWPGLHVGRAWFQAPEVDGVTWISGPGVAPGAMVRAEVVESKTYDLVALSGGE